MCEALHDFIRAATRVALEGLCVCGSFPQLRFDRRDARAPTPIFSTNKLATHLYTYSTRAVAWVMAYGIGELINETCVESAFCARARAQHSAQRAHSCAARTQRDPRTPTPLSTSQNHHYCITTTGANDVANAFATSVGESGSGDDDRARRPAPLPPPRRALACRRRAHRNPASPPRPTTGSHTLKMKWACLIAGARATRVGCFVFLPCVG